MPDSDDEVVEFCGCVAVPMATEQCFSSMMIHVKIVEDVMLVSPRQLPEQLFSVVVLAGRCRRFY